MKSGSISRPSWTKTKIEAVAVVFVLVFLGGISEIPDQRILIVDTNPRRVALSRLHTYSLRKRAVCCAMVALSAISASARSQQAEDFSAIDAYALGIPNSDATSVDRLATALKGRARTDREKARVIYRWITKNIMYDTHAFFSGNLGDMSAENVLKTRKAVCDGYAQLFAALAQSMGLEAERIIGNSKGYGYTVGSGIQGPANHAWNAVKIDGTWKLVDCTWGAGYIDDKKHFVEQFSNYYFLTPPDQFVYDHFPDDPDKQFLLPPITKEEYENLVDVRPVFFLDGLKLISHREGIVHADKRLEVVIDAPSNVTLLLQLLRDGQIQDPTLTYVDRNSAQTTLTALFPQAGTYILRLFARQSGSNDTQYDKALDYQIRVVAPMTKAVAFPALFEAFNGYGLKFKTRVEQETRVDRNVSIELSSDPDVALIASLEHSGLNLGDGFTFVQEEEGNHQIQAIFPRPGDYALTVYAKRISAPGNYNAVFAYSFNSVAMKDPDACFPVAYEQYRSLNAHLYSPLEGHLQAGTPHVFKIRVPNAEAVAIVNNDQWIQLKKDNDVFQETAAIGFGKAEVFVRVPGSKQFVGILRYQGVR